MYKAVLLDYCSGSFIAVASYEEQEQWRKLQAEGKPFMVQNRYGYPHKLIVKENWSNPSTPEKQ